MYVECMRWMSSHGLQGAFRDLPSSTDDNWTLTMSLNSFAIFTCSKCLYKLLLWVLCCWFGFCVCFCVHVCVAGLPFFHCWHIVCMHSRGIRSLGKVSDNLSLMLIFLSWREPNHFQAVQNVTLVCLSLKLNAVSPVRYVGRKGCQPTGNITLKSVTSKN